jgi:hypothetical protein
VQAHRKGELSEDDVLDALVAVVTGHAGGENLKTLPEVPEQDAHGLRMEMVYAESISSKSRKVPIAPTGGCGDDLLKP